MQRLSSQLKSEPSGGGGGDGDGDGGGSGGGGGGGGGSGDEGVISGMTVNCTSASDDAVAGGDKVKVSSCKENEQTDYKKLVQYHHFRLLPQLKEGGSHKMQS